MDIIPAKGEEQNYCQVLLGSVQNKILTDSLRNTRLSGSNVENLKSNTQLEDHAHTSAIGAILVDEKISSTNVALKDTVLPTKLMDQAELLCLMNNICMRMDIMEKGQENTKTIIRMGTSSNIKKLSNVLEGILY